MGIRWTPKSPVVVQMLGICLLLGGCASVAVPSTSVDLPAHWHHSPSIPGPRPDLQSWWKAFNDPALDALISRALAGNLTLAESKARLRAAAFAADEQSHRFYPVVQANTQNSQPPNTTDAYFQFGLDASWEFGLFGRGDAVAERTRGLLDEARAQAQGARVALVASVAGTYLQLRAAQQQTAQLTALLTLEREQERLLQTRIGLGLSARRDLAAMQADLADLETQMTEVQLSEQRHAQRLAQLLGQAEPDRDWFRPGPMPQVGSLPPTLLPADILRTRPDIQQAQARVLQAAGALGIAHADRYPQLSLEGGIFWSTDLSQYNGGLPTFRGTPVLGPVISIPLFDWGRRKAAESAQGANLNASAFAYRDTVLHAVADVENAYATLGATTHEVALRNKALASQRQSLNAEKGLLKQGLASPLQLLAVQRLQLEAARRLVMAHARQDLAFVTLYQAFGGPPLPLSQGPVAAGGS